MLSVFIREPEFVRARPRTSWRPSRRTRIVETALRDPFDHWLADNPQQAAKLLDWVIERADERLRRRQEKEIAARAPTRKLRLPGKLADCTQTRGAGRRDLHRRGRLGRRLGQAGARPRQPGGAAAARQDPQRRQRRHGQAGAEPAARRPDPGARLRHAARNTATTTCATTASSS